MADGIETPTDNTVLVVDDDEKIRLLTQLILQENGLAVLSAETGQQGLELFRRHHRAIAVALLDLTLPDMNGQEVYQQLRQLRGDLPVILMSGSENPCWPGSNESMVFLPKPFCVADLLTSIQKCLAKKTSKNNFSI